MSKFEADTLTVGELRRILDVVPNTYKVFFECDNGYVACLGHIKVDNTCREVGIEEQYQ